MVHKMEVQRYHPSLHSHTAGLDAVLPFSSQGDLQCCGRQIPFLGLCAILTYDVHVSCLYGNSLVSTTDPCGSIHR